MKITAKVKYFA